MNTRLALLSCLALTLLISACTGGVTIETTPLVPASSTGLEDGEVNVEIDINVSIDEEGVDSSVTSSGDEYTPAVYGNIDPLVFSWIPYHWEGVDSPNRAYFVALVQIDPGAPDADSDGTAIRRFAYHHVDQGQPTSFVMGNLGFYDNLCYGCLSYIMIFPVTYELTLNESTGVYEYSYTFIEGDLPTGEAESFDQIFDFLDEAFDLFRFSDTFTIENLR